MQTPNRLPPMLRLAAARRRVRGLLAGLIVCVLAFTLLRVSDTLASARGEEQKLRAAVSGGVVEDVERRLNAAVYGLRSAAMLVLVTETGADRLAAARRELEAAVEREDKGMDRLLRHIDDEDLAEQVETLRGVVRRARELPWGEPLTDFVSSGSLIVSLEEVDVANWVRQDALVDASLEMQWAALHPWYHFETLVALSPGAEAAAEAHDPLGRTFRSITAGLAEQTSNVIFRDSYFEPLHSFDAEDGLSGELLMLAQLAVDHDESKRLERELAAWNEGTLLLENDDVLERYEAALALHRSLSQLGGEAAAVADRESSARMRAATRVEQLALLVGLLIFFFGCVALFSLARRGQVEANELREAAEIDALTQLSNRFALERREPARLAVSEGVALIRADLDGFKAVNDTYGHDVGDDVLRVFADRLRRAVSDPEDSVARIGGDEFVVVLHGLDNPALRAQEVALRIQRQLEAPAVCGDREIFVRTSLGAAVSDGAAVLEDLLREADLALFEAKARETGQLVIAGQFQRRTVAAVEAALRGGEVPLLFEPLIGPERENLHEVRVLPTCAGPGGDDLDPETFREVVEWLGQGSVVRQLSLQGLVEIEPRAQDAVTRYWLRLSGAELAGPGAAERLLEELAVVGLSAERVGVELAETLPERGMMSLLAALDVLFDGGVAVMLGSVGLGDLSLKRLHKMPLHTVCLDDSLVQGLGADPSTGALIDALATVCRSLRIRLVARVEPNRRLAVDGVRGHLTPLLLSAGIEGAFLASPVAFEALDDRRQFRSGGRGTDLSGGSLA